MQDAHPEIPVGTYCYGVKDGKRFICPHWQRTDNGARCGLLNEEHHTYCPFHLVWDQVKECGINKDEPGEESEPSTIKSQGVERTVTCPCSRQVEIIDVKGNKDLPCKLEEVFRELREQNQ